jgi:NAD(P)-dependent dehydrogenase (short-subunit alcohol dehydrogenase family)
MMGVLSGRVALVTGGGRGIGRGISELLAAEGASVAINYHSGKEGAEETLRTIIDRGGTAKIYGASVADYEASSAMVKEVIRDFGHIDILVNNAGIASRGKAVADTDAVEVEKLLAVHAVGAHQLCAAVLPSMRTQERGDIEALAFTLAKEERKNGIRVNIAAPGLVETDMGVRLSRSLTGNKELTDLRSLDDNAPFGRVCQPNDVANVVLWFCSPGSAYVTGQRVQCDGGGAITSY